MAAGQAGKALQYYPFDQMTFGRELEALVTDLRARGVTVGQLYSCLCEFYEKRINGLEELPAPSCFEYVRGRFSKCVIL